MDIMLKGVVLTVASVGNFIFAIAIFVLLYGSYACFFIYMKKTDKEKLGK